jgi:uncharacterized protein (DUF1499 family)
MTFALVEAEKRPEQKRPFGSASRVGYSEVGTNRKRLEVLRQKSLHPLNHL